MGKISPINVFTPAAEIEDVQRFAGRSDELQGLARALESDGVQIVIYGNRGVGKSSLARLLDRMARGDQEVLDRLLTPPAETFDFLTVYFACDDSVDTIPRLLLRILSDDAALASWVPFKVVESEGKNSVSGKLDVKVVSFGASGSETVKHASQELETDIVSVFNNALDNLARSNIAKGGVLLIIDEFDRIRDRTGLASLMKTLAPVGVTFALVGVATTVQELITEHESVARQLSDGTVPVPPMTRGEMQEIFNRAEALLNSAPTFTSEARDWIINVSRGHPFYVHLIGKHSLLKAIEGGEATITAAAAQDALRTIALKGSAPIQESTYKTSIGHSYTREFILKRFAADEDDEIHTTDLYSQIAKDLGIEPNAVSVYVGQLASDKYGRVLEKTRERYYRFRDSLFKAYAAARPWQLEPNDQEQD